MPHFVFLLEVELSLGTASMPRSSNSICLAALKFPGRRIIFRDFKNWHAHVCPWMYRSRIGG